MRVALVVVGALALAASGCREKDSGRPSPATSASAPAGSASAPALMPIPRDAPTATPPPTGAPAAACPPEMVRAGRVCVDRWEAQLIDKSSGQALSPYYPPSRALAVRLRDQWDKERLTTGGPEAQAIGVPALPAWQTQREPELLAVSRPGAVPNGYVSGVQADRACKAAGKRLCTNAEWVTACEGAARRPFPYGDKYRQGACNIFRAKHPASVLHDNPSVGHLDPRLNLVRDASGPLLRPTGGTPECKSDWGDAGAAWDMNGNLDEWVEDEKGRFNGGFFSRSKKDGCASTVGAHPKAYFDYSTGVRCCRDAG
ncbi:MAG: SUMF1/EgtB/PvdO family nonheme iron enzyme [Polyangiaceae bacterium]|nr:SUMF1/EgtB/PvdO family nonheme iron enzyme [Polyangiaceae bacterium]